MADGRRRRAALLDRDGTIVVDEHYLADPDRVALLPGAADAIRLLARAGVPSVVCSNQSGIARGLVTLEQYRAVRLRVLALLEAAGATLLDSSPVRALLDTAPRALVVDAVRATVAQARESATAPADDEAWAAAIVQRLAELSRPSLRRVINATGIVLHTNLGRAPLADAAIDAIAAIAAGYSNLELDLAQGARGSRYVHCASLLRELTGAEDALVVNNCAAALVLALNTVADGRDALLSRGELVEIGGSFRVHEIMAKSGARLREVGATNRTHLADYERAIGPDTGVLLKVHRSNFAVHGLDLSESMFAGDKHRDVAPAVRYGAPAYLVRSPDTPEEHVARARAQSAEVVDSLLDAARHFLARPR
ncbi:MAG: L-seryl-tRNA(Sec) selenium transferase [Gemmatimonadetes bacterium]|nr:MAG: L-seryl-tRNA(Sec) selenium transferase [Gemmatimonadota bacterium]